MKMKSTNVSWMNAKDNMHMMSLTIFINAVMSAVAFLITMRLIPRLNDMFIRAGMFGIDMAKSSRQKVPEGLGVVCGAVFLVVIFLFIPVPFYQYLIYGRDGLHFPFHQYVEFLAALLSICCMIFLGFADDVLDLAWRHKLLMPTIASLPLLMVYFVTFDLTVIIVPAPLRGFFGYSVDIGLLYYVYMGMLAVFCTNAINILAGINGIEVGQSVVIATTVVIFNFIELHGDFGDAHVFALYFLLPYLGVSLALLYYNWYPAQVFVGDTFCYFSGMTFAVVAILGHFSKTMLLFMIPQVFNFVLSIPQLFKFVPCPRHRLPRYDAKSDLLYPSYSRFKWRQIGKLGSLSLHVLSIVGLIDLRHGLGEDADESECSNLTLINVVLKLLGPLREKTVTLILLSIQILCSAVALVIRYPLARLFYEK